MQASVHMFMCEYVFMYVCMYVYMYIYIDDLACGNKAFLLLPPLLLLHSRIQA